VSAETVAALLSSVLADRDWSLNRLRTVLGCAHTTVDRWCHGITLPREIELDGIADRLGIDRDVVRSSWQESRRRAGLMQPHHTMGGAA